MPRPLPPPPTASLDLEGRKKGKRSTEAKIVSAASTSCNDVFLAPKLVSKFPATGLELAYVIYNLSHDHKS